MTKFLKPIFLILGMATLLYNCQRDNVTDVSQTEIDNSAFKVRTVKLTEIPTIKSFLLEKSKNNIFSQKTIIDGAIFDQDNIMEVIDTLNQTNYSFRFTYPDTPKGVFYNLVVGKTSEGTLLDPYVLKYTTDSTYIEEFLSNNYDFTYFKGTVAVYKFTDYFTSNLGFKANATVCPTTYDAYGDPIPCDVVGLNGSGTGSGGGGTTGDGGFGLGNDGSGGSTGGGTSNGGSDSSGSTGGGVYGGNAGSGCIWYVESVIMGPCPWSDILNTCMVDVLVIDCTPQQKMNSGNKATGTTPCPDCPSGSNGGVGVNLGDVVFSDLIINTLNLSLKDPKTLWLNSVATPDELLAISNFLADNNNSVEAINLILNSIDLKLSYTTTNYPGINDGLPYKWWTDTNAVVTNPFFKVPSIFQNTPDETPNVKEVALFILFPEFSPTHIKNARKALTEAQRLANEVFIFNQQANASLNNGKADAFRHAFWNALDTSDFGSGITKMFTDAHEWGETGLPVTMDLYNNNQGRIIGANYDSTTNDSVISDAILDTVLTGLLKYIKDGMLVPSDQ